MVDLSITNGYSYMDDAAITSIVVWLLTLSDDYSLADVPSSQEVFKRVILDPYSLADAISTLRERRLSLTDAYSHLDALATQEAFYRILADAFTLADPLATQEVLNRYIIDGYALVDVLIRARLLHLSLIDAFIHQSVSRPPQISLFKIEPTLPKTQAESLEGVPLPPAKTIAQHLEKLLNP